MNSLETELAKAFDPETREISFFVIAHGNDEFILEEDPSGRFRALLPMWVGREPSAFELEESPGCRVEAVRLSELRFFKDPFVNEGIGTKIVASIVTPDGMSFDELRDVLHRSLSSYRGNSQPTRFEVPAFWSTYLLEENAAGALVSLPPTVHSSPLFDSKFQILDIEEIFAEADEGFPEHLTATHGYVPIGTSFSGDVIAIRRSERDDSPVYAFAHDDFLSDATEESDGAFEVLQSISELKNLITKSG